MRTPRARCIAILALGLACAPAGSAAQTGGWARTTAPAPDRGWIGISFDVVRDRRGRAIDVIITGVNDDSPAGKAGVRPGDRVLAINELHRPDDLEFLTERLAIRSGDRVVVEVERGSSRHRFSLRAATLPEDLAIGRSIEWTLQSDSMVDSWFRAMDSLRIELVTDGARTVRVRSTSDDGGQLLELIAPRPPLQVNGGEPAPSARFQFFVLGSEPRDSLRAELSELARLSDELELRMEARERELRGVVRARGSEGDLQVLELRASLEATEARSAAVREAIAETRSRSGVEAAREASSWDPAPRAPAFGPLTPYALGSNRVAGANVVDLKPELARYFKVDGGILVVDVAPGTPAALAGVVPGDVITQVDQVGVHSIAELRSRVSLAGERLPITLVREGTPRQVVLRR